MKIKNFEFHRVPSTGGMEILVRQGGENSPVISELQVSEAQLYELLAHLDLSADEELDDDDLVFDDDDVESEDSEDEEEA